MLKKLSVAALVAAMSFATLPTMISVAQAQGGANEPPTAPDPSDAAKGGGADAGKSDAAPAKPAKKAAKHHSKKKHH